MMGLKNLNLFKSLWCHQGSLTEAIEMASKMQLTGIEGQVPTAPSVARAFQAQLKSANLAFIAELTTAGSYVPDRSATVAQHLEDFKIKLARSAPLEPLFVTCLGGCDAWSQRQSVDFFGAAIALAEDMGMTVSFETHRGRSFFNPWVTDQIVQELPQILLTCDYSHWCVVCERIVDTEQEVLQRLTEHAHHIHGRVGYEQGPQVPHPAAPEYTEALKAHQRWWEAIWYAQWQRGYQVTTMTPEFGPDGYLQARPFSGELVADLNQINDWMVDHERAHFAHWCNSVAAGA